MTKEDAVRIIKSECYVFNPMNLDRTAMINKALDKAIESLSEDSVNVVRCKDCFNYRYGKCGLTDAGMLDTDFCSYGERWEV